MKSPIIIAGLESTGKTSFICSLLQLGKERQLNGAGFKPFDSGLLKRNAVEQLGDGELFCLQMVGEPAETLVSPYCAHEDYPLEMSLRRDGINIKWSLVQERMKLLNDLYDFTCIELPGSLFTPITEEMMVIDWLKNLEGEIIWMFHPEQYRFNQNLSELKCLMALDLDFSVVFNNVTPQIDQDLLFYIWEKTEKFTVREAAGMLPYVGKQQTIYPELGSKIEDNLSALLESFIAD